MKGFLLLPLLFLVFSCEPVYAGLGIQVEAQQPEYRTVNGPNGPELWPVSATPPVLPAGAVEVCRSNPWNVFSADQARRTIVYKTAAGTATSMQAFAACPQLREMKRSEIRAEGDRRLGALATPYMQHERETWHVQQAEAEAWQLNNAAPVPMLADIAKGRGITFAALVAKVMENTNLFRASSGVILGQQQFLLDWIDREPDFETLANVGWE